VDAAVLDAVLGELRPRLLGRALAKCRPVAPHAVSFEILGDRGSRLWIDASRLSAGLFWLSRDSARRLADEAEATGRTRHALLLLRKHLEGRRVSRLARWPGHRTVLIEAGPVSMVLRLSGAPAATLAVDGAALVTWGEGNDPWPPPTPDPGREESWHAGGAPEAVVALSRALEGAHDTDFVAPSAQLGSIPTGMVAVSPGSWLASSALYLEVRLRGARFEGQRSAVVGAARREQRRLARLEEHLRRDLEALPDAEELRHSAGALLATPGAAPVGATQVEVPDPHAPGRTRSVALDPRIGAHANVDRLFEKARRIERARQRVESRLAETRAEITAAARREAAALEARDRSDLAPAPANRLREAEARSGPRHYLTSRGLSMLVGRGARENHHLTFAVARGEDLWLHARDVPGGHVILRDPESRAGSDDIREAAEVAAFFSDARTEGSVDVHVARRKNLRSAGGGGRVRFAHSDTVRVVPRDPEGRLRKR
jgi:hypothetical protein